MIQLTNPYGIYRVGQKTFSSKFEALEEQIQTGIHVHWDFHEDVFSSYNWTVEPHESLEELYAKRAQQLRDKYDYLILQYSGGADSENILRAFLANDIKLDEVVSLINYSVTQDQDSWMNQEIFKTAVPYLDHIKEQYKSQPIKHRIFDMVESQIKYWTNQKNRYSWIYENNFGWNPNNPVQASLVEDVPEWKEMIRAGKRLCVITGTDKPRLYWINGKLSYRFVDIIGGVAPATGPDRWDHELFYWTPDLPEMLIKQAHVVKKFLSYNDVSPNFFTTSTDGLPQLAYKEVAGTTYWLKADCLNELVYPDWTPGKISCAKPKSMIFGNRDPWFFSLEQTNPLKEIWRIGLEKVWTTLPDYWKNDPTNIAKGFKLCLSKPYFLD